MDLASKVTVKYIFDLCTYEGSPEDLSLRITYTDLWGEAQEFTLTEAEAYNADRGLYCFAFDGLLAAELRQVLSAQIYAGQPPSPAPSNTAPTPTATTRRAHLGISAKH